MERRRQRPAGGATGIRWRAFVTPWLVLLAGIGLSVGAFFYRESNFEAEHADRFDRETSSVLASISETMRSYEGVVNGLHGLFAADGAVSQEDFRWYADSILLETRFPGLWGIAATRNVPSEQVGRFLETGEIFETPGEEYRPGQLDKSYIVTHAEPERLHVGLGIDARLFEPMGEAMDRSRDKGSIQLGGPFTIPLQPGAEDESEMPTIMVLSKPVFDTQEVPETRAERRRHLYGWVGLLIDAKPFAATSTGEFGDHYRVEIFDGKRADAEALIAESRRTEADGGRRRTTTRDFFGRAWTIRVTESVPAKHSRSESLTLLLGGSAISALLFALLFVTGRSEQRALRMVDRATDELSRKERHFRALVANSNDIIAVVDGEGRMRYVSPSAARMLGYDEDELLGRDILEHVHPDDAEWLRTGLNDELVRDQRAGPVEFRIHHRDGQWRYLEAVAVNLLDDPAVEGIVFNCRDVTERKAFERDLAYQATHDPLTGLPNRSLLLDRLGQALARGSRSGNRPAVLFVDLDRFKFVNDSLGHSAGDELLVLVAERLQHTVRPGDTVARFGGDEFVVLAESVVDIAECRAIAERMAGVLATPFCVVGHEVFVTASIGMTIATDEVDTPETLLRDADAAMYRAKEQGRARSEVFDVATYRNSVDRLEIENALHRAIERGELVLHYQPLFDLRTGAVTGVEALLRWQHPERGLVPPLDFIELAEDTGLIVPIGEWVLREACRQGERWRRQLPADSAFTVSVNLSSRQLAHPQLPGTVMRILSDTNLPAGALSLEITEGSLMQDVTTTVRTLDMLKSLGVRLAIDDFGSGYASLGHLNRFPVDSLKIDRTFVEGLGHDSDGTVIVAAVIGLAHALGVTAVAEGVETQAQLAELRALRCDAAQGFLFARPAPAAELDLLAPFVDLDLSGGDGSTG